MLNKISKMLDDVADRLEARGLIKEAYEIDKISNQMETQLDKSNNSLKNHLDPNKPSGFVYSSYWGTWSRLLGTVTENKNLLGIVEVDLTPINMHDGYNKWAETSFKEDIAPIKIRVHSTGTGDYAKKELPQEIIDIMKHHLGEPLTQRLVTSDLASEIDYNLLIKKMRGGGVTLNEVKL